MQGVITFYLNYDIEKQKAQELINVFKQENKELLEELPKAGFFVAVVPTTNEATRVEKVDFEFPFPRFAPRKADIMSLSSATPIIEKKDKEKDE